MPFSNGSWNECRISVTEQMGSSTVHFVFAYLLPSFACIGLIGNTLTLITLNSSKNAESKKTSMFLSAKAVADFGVGLFTILFNLNAYEAKIDSDEFSKFYYHRLLKPVFAIVNCMLMSSTWFAVAVTFERMFAIGWPLRARHALTTGRIAITIMCIALISFIFTIYPMFILHEVTFPNCKRLWRHVYINRGPLSSEQPYLWLYGIVARFLHHFLATVVPVILLLAFNCTIVLHMRQHTRSLARFTDAGYTLKDAGEQVRISLVVFTITAATAVFLLPSAAVVVYDALNPSRKSRAYQAFVNATNLLVLCDKVLDFFLYCLVSGHFRKRLKKTCVVRRWMKVMGRRSSNKSLDTFVMMSMAAQDVPRPRHGSVTTVKSKPSMPL